MVEKRTGRRAKAGQSIVERLAGKRIFLTGVTGFLGQVVLERLLADFPETRIVLLVRSQTGASSVERVHYLTRKPSFDTLRATLGSDDALLRLLDDRSRIFPATSTSRSTPRPRSRSTRRSTRASRRTCWAR